MPVCAVGDLVDALWRNRLIDLPLLEELADRTRAPAGTPGVLAEELVARGRLTRFQADECLAGRAARLALGPYRFLDLLGHGALGRVYRARQSETGDVVAVKVLHAGVLSDREQEHRFHREAETAARLRHPNVVAVLDDGVEQGTHYLVMEHVEGVNLGQFLETAGPLEPTVACALTRQVALALEHASQRLLVPDGVRASDLIVTGGHGAASLKIKVLLAGQGSVGRSGHRLGEFDFGSLLQCDRADDRPFPFHLENETFREDVQAAMSSLAGLFELMVRGNESATRTRTSRPELPADLKAVLEKMAATEPRDRFRTFAECADALAPFAGLSADPPGGRTAPDRPMTPAIPDVPHQTGRVARSRWWKSLPAIVLLYLAGVAAGLALMRSGPDSSRDADRDLSQARAVAQPEDDLPRVEGEDEAAADAKPRPEPIVEENPEPRRPGLALARAEAGYSRQLEMGERDLKEGKLDDAIARFGEAIALRPDHARAYLLRAEAYSGREANREAIADCDSALGLDPDNALAYRLRGAARERLNDHAGAIADATSAIALRPDDALAYNDRGLAHFAQGDARGAVDDLTRAVKLDGKLPTTLGNLAWILATAADPGIRNGGRAVIHATRACELTGWRDPVLLKDLAAAYAACGQFDRAAAFQDRALEHAVRLPQAEVVQYRRMLDEFRARSSAPLPWKLQAGQARVGIDLPGLPAFRAVQQALGPNFAPPPPVPAPPPGQAAAPDPRPTILYRSNLHSSRRW